MTVAPFPHHYSVAIERDQLAAGPRAPIQVGAPPQFGGSAHVWSPEELLVGAVLMCVQTTFASYARNANVEIYEWAGRATGVLDKSPTGAAFTAIRVELDIQAGPGTEHRIRELLRMVARTCTLSRAIAAPIEVISTISELARAS